MSQTKFRTLDDQTLSPRHFDGLGLSSRQLHLWLKQLGWEDERQKPRGWRSFSPVDVLRLYLLKELKEATGFSLSKHFKLVEFVTCSKSFVEETLTLFRQDQQPVLITNMAETHLVAALLAADLAPLFKSNANVLVIADLNASVHQMIAATKAGGTTKQQSLCEKLERSNTIAFPKVSAITSSAASLDTIRKRQRKLDLSNAPRPNED